MNPLRLFRVVVFASVLVGFVGLVRGAVTTAASHPPMQAPLETVRRALEQTATTLGTSTAVANGIFLEKAQADLARAIEDVKAAIALAQSNPALGDVPATVPPAAEQVRLRLNYTRQNRPTAQTNMYGAFPFLKIALAALQSVPGGDLGGYREKIVASIGQTGADIIAGIEYADSSQVSGGFGTGASSRSGGAAIRFATAASDAADAERAPPTAQARLVTLQDVLSLARDTLRRAPAGSPGQTEADKHLERALKEVTDALAYLKAHPDENLLPTEPLTVSLPGLALRSPVTNSAASQLGISVQNLYTIYPSVFPVLDVLAAGIFNFVNGTPLNTGSRGPVLGALGGHRDRVLRCVAEAAGALETGVAALLPPGPASAAPPPVAPTAAMPGAIAGLVVDSAGDPAANVLISFAPVPVSLPGFVAPTYVPGGYPRETPAAITDELGAFKISDLPPGDYVVTAILISARGNWRLTGTLQLVNVQEGETTQLPAPFSPPLKLK